MRYTEGHYVVSGAGASKVNQWADELSLHAERSGAVAGGVPVAKRLGLYKPWTASMDEGWTEWLLDQYDMRYTTLTNADVRAGDLASRFDVILIASDAPRSILEGYGSGNVPPRYEGGVGDAGVRALDEFVRNGGTLVCLNRSANFAIDALHLPVKDTVRNLARKDFFASGSMVSSGRWLFDSFSLELPSEGAEANRNCGVEISELCIGPCVGAKKHASAPARCQPRTIKSCELCCPSSLTPAIL